MWAAARRMRLRDEAHSACLRLSEQTRSTRMQALASCGRLTAGRRAVARPSAESRERRRERHTPATCWRRQRSMGPTSSPPASLLRVVDTSTLGGRGPCGTLCPARVEETRLGAAETRLGRTDRHETPRSLAVTQSTAHHGDKTSRQGPAGHCRISAVRANDNCDRRRERPRTGPVI